MTSTEDPEKSSCALKIRRATVEIHLRNPLEHYPDYRQLMHHMQVDSFGKCLHKEHRKVVVHVSLVESQPFKTSLCSPLNG